MKFKLLYIILLLTAISCNKVKEYFRDPETEVLVKTIRTTTIVGYAANVAMAKMCGEFLPNVTCIRSNPDYPCLTIMVVEPDDQEDYFLNTENPAAITIVGFWSDQKSAVLSLLITDYNDGTNEIDLVGIETIPVIRDVYNIKVALASQDIQLNPDEDALLSLNLDSLEFRTELLRLDAPQPSDVYVAVTQNAYFIEVYNNGSFCSAIDDDYTITGGGQLIEIDGHSAEIIQQAMIEVKTGVCSNNPADGMALIRVTGLENEGLPELGTALLEFTGKCNGTAKVFIATGMYAGCNGQDIPFVY